MEKNIFISMDDICIHDNRCAYLYIVSISVFQLVLYLLQTNGEHKQAVYHSADKSKTIADKNSSKLKLQKPVALAFGQKYKLPPSIQFMFHQLNSCCSVATFTTSGPKNSISGGALLSVFNPVASLMIFLMTPTIQLNPAHAHECILHSGDGAE